MNNERPEKYFPDIIDERSSYLNLSPLTAIIQDLRRKNVVTAASASGPQMSLLDSSDPWGSSEGSGLDDQEAVTGSFGSTNSSGIKSTPRRHTSWAPTQHRPSPFVNSSFTRTPENTEYDRPGVHNARSVSGNLVSSQGGRMRNMSGEGLDARNPRQLRYNTLFGPSRLERLEYPQHARALLRSTPQLRIISPASTDMQGAGGSNSTSLLSLIISSPSSQGGKSGPNDGIGSSRAHTADYGASLVRDRANHQAAAELSSLLWILAHEMSLEDYGAVESEVFTSVFALVHSKENERRMAGLAALDALIDAPSADEEKKAIKFANTLSNGLRSAHGDYEFLSAVSKALGHMATRTANVDFVESEVTRALEWLRTERSDRR